MKFYEALNQTLKEYGISANWLSEKSGVSIQMISNYRRGKQRVYSDSLEAMIAALPLEIQQHFYKLMNRNCVPQIADLNENELADLMDEVARVLRNRTAVRSPLVRI